MKEQLTSQLFAFESDHIWINKNRETLLKQYTDQWIAVKDGHVIGSNPDLKCLLSKLPKPSYTCVEFLTRDPLEMVL